MAKQDKPETGETRTVERAPIETRLLPVKLTRDEVFIRGKELATAQQERAAKERELDRVVQAAKGAKEALQAEIDALSIKAAELAEVVRAEHEDRRVEVRNESDFTAGVVNTIRLDTGAVVATRGLTEAERQRPIPFNPPRKVEGKGQKAKPEAGAPA